jgi:Protein kinase domain
MSIPPDLSRALGGAYTIERPIGQGGIATVYLARDEKHGRRVALKMLRPELAASLGVERFLREIRIAASLSHPNILPLYDSVDSTEAGPLCFIMPYVDGDTLRMRLSNGPLTLGEALGIAIDVAGAPRLCASSRRPSRHQAGEHSSPRRTCRGHGLEMLAGTAPFAGPTISATRARVSEARVPPFPAHANMPSELSSEARTILDQIRDTDFDLPPTHAAVLLALGDTAAAIGVAERGVVLHDPLVVDYKVTPWFDLVSQTVATTRWRSRSKASTASTSGWMS